MCFAGVTDGMTAGKPGKVMFGPGPLTLSRNASNCHAPAAAPPTVAQWKISSQGSGSFGARPVPIVRNVSGAGAVPRLFRMQRGSDFSRKVGICLDSEGDGISYIHKAERECGAHILSSYCGLPAAWMDHPSISCTMAHVSRKLCETPHTSRRCDAVTHLRGKKQMFGDMRAVTARSAATKPSRL